MINALTHLSLFTGIGGIDLAAEWAGIRTVAQVERDPFCQQVLAKHWPDVPRYDDVRAVTGDALRDAGIGRPALVSGGFPCQPFSVAGQRRGAEDDRFLWPEMCRIVSELRPDWVLGENVSGFVNMALDDVLADLERIGYTCRAFAVPAAGVGAPHQRERVFIVAHSGGKPGRETPAASVPVREGSGSRHHAPCCGVRQPAGGAAEDVANASRELPYRSRRARRGRPELTGRCADVPDAVCTGCQELDSTPIAEGQGFGAWCADPFGGQWAVERGICGMVDGVSEGLDGSIMSNEPHILGLYADAEERRSREVLQVLRKTHGSEANQREVGGSGNVHPPQVLRPGLYGCCDGERQPYGSGTQMESGASKGRQVRDMWNGGVFAGSPLERRYYGQRSSEPNDVVRILSREMALGEWQILAEEAIGLHRLWCACTQIGYVPETLSALQEVWQSLPYEEARWTVMAARFGPWVDEWPNTPRISSNSSFRGDRLRALGNAVVPQQVYPILRGIAMIERGESL